MIEVLAAIGGVFLLWLTCAASAYFLVRNGYKKNTGSVWTKGDRAALITGCLAFAPAMLLLGLSLTEISRAAPDQDEEASW